MKEQKKSEQGITLVALMITIIVMLILAAVSVRTIVGDNGILSSAEDAKTETELAEILEEINYMLLEYNVGDEDITISAFLNTKLAEGEIDKFIAYPTDDDTYGIMIQVDGYYYDVQETKGVYEATFLGEDPDGYDVITKETFNEDGTLYYDLGDGESITVLFMDSITADLNIEVASGEVTVYITQDMDLTNENLERSAIDIVEGATLNLHLASGTETTVDSGYGIDAEGNTAGTGGYAGIHVPEGATLNLYGSGTIIAIGGDASDGASSDSSSSNAYVAGGGGAGAGIGGNGGNGAIGKVGVNSSSISYKATSGGSGENAGEINIYNDVVVYAYGGAGGSGGTGSEGGGGAGGYPAAGIGGGGAGAAGSTCCTGAGGYSGGTGKYNTSYFATNGLAGGNWISGSYSNSWGSGGGYYQGSNSITETRRFK